VVAQDLTRQPHAKKFLRVQSRALGNRACLRLAMHEFDTARRATRAAAARVQLIDARVLFKREHQPLARRDFKCSDVDNSQRWHFTDQLRLYRILIVGMRYSRNACWKSYFG